MGFGGNMYTAVLALVFLFVFLSVGALFFTLWEVGLGFCFVLAPELELALVLTSMV